MEKYIKLIKEYSKENYNRITKEPVGDLKYPFIVPGVNSYCDELWDWDSWLTDIAITQIREDNNLSDEEYEKYEKGCIMNFLNFIGDDGYVPVCIHKDNENFFVRKLTRNAHKPCLCQHALFICKKTKSDISWIKDNIDKLKKFVSFYMNNCKHRESGLYFWIDDGLIGVDNEPCCFYRPDKSCASLFLNCLMYKELESLVELCNILNENCDIYEEEMKSLKLSIQTNLWDERDGSYYSADLNLKPIDKKSVLHSGAPRHWSFLIQRIDSWTNFMPMWAGIATKEQACSMVKNHMMNKETFYSNYGIRSLSKKEKMYAIKKSGNPSCWLGPIWGISNYMCFIGLLNYGYKKEAEELAQKTITLFGRDLERNGVLHEYYDSDSGEGVNNPGFQSWNLLVNNIIKILYN